jgi:predicted nucleotidyltransferase
MSKAQAKKIVKKYSEKLRASHYPLSAIYLYGSYAKGNAGKWSDIDVAVVADRLNTDWWKNEKLLSNISLEVDSRIEPHGFTVKDFADDCDPMVYEIKKTGIRIV